MSIELADIVSKLRARSDAGLTEREYATLRLLARGMVGKQIGHELGISWRTVENYRKSLLVKLDAKTPAQAVYMACQRGLI